MSALERGFMLVPDELGAHLDAIEKQGREIDLDVEGFVYAGLAHDVQEKYTPLILTFSEARRIADAVRNLPKTNTKDYRHA